MSKNVMRAFNTPKKDDGVRNVFDLSQRHIFSAKAGQIIPVACVDTVPGDKSKTLRTPSSFLGVLKALITFLDISKIIF